MYVFVYLDDGTAYSSAIFNWPFRLVSAPNYYWVDITDNQDLQVLYEGMWTVPPTNVNGFPSAWGNDPEAGYMELTVTPGYDDFSGDGFSGYFD
jgi:hypothetical protein